MCRGSNHLSVYDDYWPGIESNGREQEMAENEKRGEPKWIGNNDSVGKRVPTERC